MQSPTRFIRQRKGYVFYGFQLYTYDGVARIDDPMGQMHGWALAIGLPFVILNIRNIKTGLVGVEA